MRLLADKGNWHLAIAPQRQVEGQPGQDRNDDIDDLCRQADQLHDRDRLVVYGDAEDLFQDLAQIVLNQHRAEHEAVARVLGDRLNAVGQMFQGLKVFLDFQPSHLRLDLPE